MTAGKMQKSHPSRYGRWIKIQLNPDAPYKETAVPRSGSAPAEREPVRRNAPAAADPDLKRLDEILGAEYASDEQPQQQEPSATFEEDESLEALESVISGIKQKTIKHAARESSSAEPANNSDQTDDTLQEAVSLLKKDTRINLSEIEKQVFSSAEETAHSPHLQSIEETEDQYLRELEARYEQEKK